MFANSLKLFSLKGFDIKLDLSWFLIASLVTWSLSRQYFPNTFPDQTRGLYLAMALIAMVCFFASLLLHEMAHAIVARRFGVPIKAITLFIFGGVAEMGAEPARPNIEFWVALAGPAMSMFLAFGLWVTASIADLILNAPVLTQILSYLALINLVLAIFNLVPAFPLDGGRVLRAYLWHRSGNILQATETASKSGTVFAYVLMALGVLGLFQGATVSGLWQIMIGIFILTAARASFQDQLARHVFDGKTVRALMQVEPVTVGPEVTLAEFVNRIMLHKGVSFVPVLEDGVLLGHIDGSVLSRIDREHWANTRVGDVFVGLDPTELIAPDLAVQDLMAQIAKTGRRKFLVVDDHQLIGVVSLADLTRYLHVSDLLRHQ
jgi:Zn-dependent protease/CBS domain-containing protein